MKLNGFVGKGSGKLGSSVFAISGGEQIVREYNPVVANPNTEAQIAQRAKLKLMSQLAAALAPALGFAKQGLVSARNQFVSKNIGLANYADGSAEVDLDGLNITPSSAPLPGLALPTSQGGNISVALASAADDTIKRVAYFLYEKTEDNKLVYVASKIVTEAGNDRTFPTTISYAGGSIVLFAYGIKDNSVESTMRYENYVAAIGDASATLDVIALFRSSGYGLTKTVVLQTDIA